MTGRLTPRQELVAQLVAVHGSHAAAADVLREYRRALGPERGEMSPVMKDLAPFCGMRGAAPVRADDPHPNENLQRTEGRREVWFRIEMLLSIDPEEVARAGDPDSRALSIRRYEGNPNEWS